MILTSIIFLNNNMGRVGSKLVCYTAAFSVVTQHS